MKAALLAVSIATLLVALAILVLLIPMSQGYVWHFPSSNPNPGLTTPDPNYRPGFSSECPSSGHAQGC